MVDSCAESLRTDSSRMDVCSGEDPCFDGICARAASFSTCVKGNGERKDPPTSLVYSPDQKEPQDKHTAISKSTIFSANVLISLSKQKRYSPAFCAVKTKSP